jgi:hypothetical protein
LIKTLRCSTCATQKLLISGLDTKFVHYTSWIDTY